MTLHHLVVLVYTEVKALPPDPVSMGFFERLDPLFRLAENHQGFIGRATPTAPSEEGTDPADWDWGPWGPFDEPYWYDGPTGPGRRTGKNLSVWADLESVLDYTYRTDHIEVVQRRQEWTVDRGTPSHVAYWIEARTAPTFNNACRRIEQLHEDGPAPDAFTLTQAFDTDGEPVVRQKF